MKKKWIALTLFSITAIFLAGCDNPLLIFDPKGPQARTLSSTILFSMAMMAGILFVVYVLYTVVLVKYRASKLNDDYEPPHEEGNKWLEIIWTAIPVILVVVLSFVTVSSTSTVEQKSVAYADQKPVVIYASSSNWKWHFSYPEEGIETVNYVNFPANRPIEFRLYSYGPITSFWIPQLAGQKYAMSDMVTKIHMSADVPGSFMGKNSNFSGKGFAQMEFEAQALSDADYKEWVADVKATAPKLTEDEFDNLLKAEQVGRKTYSSNHLEFRPAPEMDHGGHHHGGSTSTGDKDKGHEDMDMDMDHDAH
ncbi:cytochrome aa3 quinol oxidase subunit II [Sporosarcina sp. BI001-red]|uniref:cytochrome aa3 quinol oxidase subunit II n=1 Tax=Sporosarcina sp. BI001-red TaxID=2282866 RepID=UPI000E265506|nr:cytochrome aa3 quinol oxidase subunit II [Sporosarcina sp. BI001-red]REB09589.1 cytochrome aa3 quinol oxidase subunit II [Sporosarcina sp. BI001-red]